MSVITKKQMSFIVAFMSTDTIERAAETAGIAQTTAYKYLKDQNVISAMRELKAEVIRQVTRDLSSAGGKAVKTLEEIMGNKKAPAHARVSAARTILEHLHRYYQTNEVLDILDEADRRAKLLE